MGHGFRAIVSWLRSPPASGALPPRPDVVARMGRGTSSAAVLEGDVASPRGCAAGPPGESAEAAEPPLLLDGRELRVTASIGGALADGTHASAEDLLRDADLAMYYAKTSGHGAVAALRRNDAERPRTRGSGCLHGSPGPPSSAASSLCATNRSSNLRSGRATAFEALLRWHHRERGTVAPSNSSRVAETTGLSVPIGARGAPASVPTRRRLAAHDAPGGRRQRQHLPAPAAGRRFCRRNPPLSGGHEPRPAPPAARDHRRRLAHAMATPRPRSSVNSGR